MCALFVSKGFENSGNIHCLYRFNLESHDL